MSRAIITLVDNEDEIDVRLEFDPPVGEGRPVSGAQWLASEMLKMAARTLDRAEDEAGTE